MNIGTWFDSSHDLLVTIQEYTVFWWDRVHRRRGGVCLYAKSELIVNMRDDIDNRASDKVESLWLELERDKAN